jgi:hypothetical protein
MNSDLPTMPKTLRRWSAGRACKRVLYKHPAPLEPEHVLGCGPKPRCLIGETADRLVLRVIGPAAFF